MEWSISTLSKVRYEKSYIFKICCLLEENSTHIPQIKQKRLASPIRGKDRLCPLKPIQSRTRSSVGNKYGFQEYHDNPLHNKIMKDQDP